MGVKSGVMGMDSGVIRALSIELFDRLRGVRLRTVEQFDPWEFALKTDMGDLLISCHQRFKRIVHVRTEEKPVSTHFARTCQDILRHCKIQGIEQRDLDRVVEIELGRDDSIAGDFACSIMVELVGRSGNAVVVSSEGKVLATLRKSRRNVVSGLYRSPGRPSGKDPDQLSPGELGEAFAKDKSCRLAEGIQRAVTGFGRLLSNEAAFRAGLNPDAEVGSCSPEDLAAAGEEVLSLYRDLQNSRFSPTVYYDGDMPIEFSCFELLHLGKLRKQGFGSMVEAILEFHAKALISEKAEEKKRLLLQHLKRSIRKVRARLVKQAEDLASAREAETYRVRGDAILLNLGSIEKGVSSVKLTNPHKPEEAVVVELIPGKSLQETAQSYFRQYKKMKKAIPVIKGRIAESEAALRQLEDLKAILDDEATADEVERVTEVLSQKGIIQRPRERKQKERKQYRVFVTGGGWEVVVGRSRQENEEITFRVAKPRDLFFHVSSAPGSHTIMRVQGRAAAPSKKDIEEAASIAAYYSKARTSRLVSVSYTERRYVRKPRKAPQGTVIVERVKTVMVEPRKPS